MDELLLASAALALLQKLLPVIEDKIKTGEITPEEQQKARDVYLAFRQSGDSLFIGPEWEQS